MSVSEFNFLFVSSFDLLGPHRLPRVSDRHTQHRLLSTQAASRVLGQASGLSSAHENETFYISICPQTVFEVQPPRSPDLSPSDIYLVYSDAIENEDTFCQSIFRVCQTILNRLGTFKGERQPLIRHVNPCVELCGRCFELLLVL